MLACDLSAAEVGVGVAPRQEESRCKALQMYSKMADASAGVASLVGSLTQVHLEMPFIGSEQSFPQQEFPHPSLVFSYLQTWGVQVQLPSVSRCCPKLARRRQLPAQCRAQAMTQSVPRGIVLTWEGLGRILLGS